MFLELIVKLIIIKTPMYHLRCGSNWECIIRYVQCGNKDFCLTWSCMAV